MSLVINSNDGGGGFVVSNSNIDTYPDFKNSILMFPNSLKRYNASNSFSVGGTWVFDICWSMSETNFFQSTTSVVLNQWVWISLVGSGVNSAYSRLYAFKDPLDAWMVVGKNITFPPRLLWVFNYANAYSQSVKLSAVILHADWSKTTLNTVNYGWIISTNTWHIYSEWSPSFCVLHTCSSNNVFNNSGRVLQEWDRLWFELSFTSSGQSSNNNFSVSGVMFWTPRASVVDVRIMPIQVSID